MTSRKHGGARPKRRPNDKRGGARRGAGGLVRNLHLDEETARELRIITLHRRALTNNPALQPVDIVTQLIHGLWLTYDAMIQETEEATHDLA